MNIHFHSTIAGLLLATIAQQALATDVAHGKKLHDENCMSCHDTSVYTREERRVSTLDGLEKQVQRCELSQELRWFEEDKADVTSYLNDTFYHF